MRYGRNGCETFRKRQKNDFLGALFAGALIHALESVGLPAQLLSVDTGSVDIESVEPRGGDAGPRGGDSHPPRRPIWEQPLLSKSGSGSETSDAAPDGTRRATLAVEGMSTHPNPLLTAPS